MTLASDAAVVRARRRALLAVVACYAAIVAVLFAESLFGGKVLVQLDALYRFEPWRSLRPDHVPANELLLDQSIVMLPWNDFAAEELRKGELPLWSPYGYAGLPLVGACQPAIYWPLHWLHYAFPSLNTYAWTGSLELLLTGLFGFLFLRRLALANLAAALGGLAFMLSGFQVLWLGHPMSNVGMLVPAMLWAVERAAARRRPGDHALFGVLVALQLVAGHVQTSMHASAFVAAWIVFRTFVATNTPALRARGLRGLIVGAGFGVILASPQLAPVLEYVVLSQARTELARTDLTASFPVADAASLLVAPLRFGSPLSGDWAKHLTGPNLNFNELNGGYVGRLALLLAMVAVAGLARRGGIRARTAFFAIATVFAAGVAWHVEPFHAFARAVPGFAQTKLLRGLLFVAFGLAVLAAIGLDAMLARLRRARVPVGIACCAIVAVELLAFGRGYNPQIDPALCLPATKTTDFLRAQGPTFRTVGLDNTALMPNANTFYRVPMLSGYDSVEYREVTELVLRAGKTRPDFAFVSRMNAFDNIDALPMLSLFGVRWILSPVPLPPPLRLAADTEVDVWENPGAMPKAFAASALEVIEDGTARVDRIASATFDPRIAVLARDSEAAARWRASRAASAAPDAVVELVRYEPREIELRVSATRPELIVVNDAFAPGWHAHARNDAGERELVVERVDHALRGIWVEPGEHTIVMRYDPASTFASLVLAALAAVALLMLASRTPPRDAVRDLAINVASGPAPR
ncbi:MAG: hypothetical protein HZB39_11225 [Planctomycetes bacterium]|nr:hypothetical protein [Planctomycetota bacterium]